MWGCLATASRHSGNVSRLSRDYSVPPWRIDWRCPEYTHPALGVSNGDVQNTLPAVALKKPVVNKSRLSGSEIDGVVFNATASPKCFQNAAGFFQNAGEFFTTQPRFFQNAGWDAEVCPGNVGCTRVLKVFCVLGMLFITFRSRILIFLRLLWFSKPFGWFWLLWSSAQPLRFEKHRLRVEKQPGFFSKRSRCFSKRRG